MRWPGRARSPDPGSRVATADERRVARLDRVVRIGTALIFGQFIFLIVWSAFLYTHYDLASDYGMRLQAWTAIAHGNLSAPVTTSPHFAAFWRDHFELVDWPLAPLIYLWPHAFWLEIAQCVGISGACLVAFRWGVALMRAPAWNVAVAPWWVAIVSLVIIISNPWTIRTGSYDVHLHTTLGAFFALLLARSVFDERRGRIVVFTVLTLLCGDVAGLFVIGIGISTVLARRRQWRVALVLGVVGAGWILFVHATGGDLGTGVGRRYGELVGASAGIGLGSLVLHLLLHPSRLLQTLWSKQVTTWAFVGASGLLGVFTPWGIGVTALVLLSSDASALPNASSPFQNFPLTGFMLVGTVAAIGWLACRFRRSWPVYLITGVLIANSLGWAVVWIARDMDNSSNVSQGTADALAEVQREIPAQAPVVLLEGDGGRFAARPQITLIAGPPYGPTPVPVAPHSAPIYWIITPYQGSQGVTTDVQLGILARLVSMHARLVFHGPDVWVFRWVPPPGVRSVPITHATVVPAWALRSAHGSRVVTGPTDRWRMVSVHRTGYVTDGAYWHEGVGEYTAFATLDAKGSCRVEVWDTTTKQLVGQRLLKATTGIATVSLPFDLTHVPGIPAERGVEPFVFDQIRPPNGDSIEIRVWAPRSSRIAVYQEGLAPTIP